MKADRLKPWTIGLAAILMAALIITFMVKTGNTRREYERLASSTPEPTLAPPDLAFVKGEALLRNGSIGPEVIQLQKRLFELGYYDGDIDGKYYAGTAAAVLAFQTQHQLAADGMAGALTLNLLYSSEAQMKAETVPDPSGSASLPLSPKPPEGVYTSPAPGAEGN